MKSALIWDIFCKVIDNYGDIGVSWRLCAGLAARGERVRLWVDDPSALQWMAPLGCIGVDAHVWSKPLDLSGAAPGNVLVEAFGCEVAPEFVAFHAQSAKESGIKQLWINLEYLSAEAFVRDNHGLPSPVMAGPGSGLTKHFFYPGFNAGTGGLLREDELIPRQAHFERDQWLAQLGIEMKTTAEQQVVSLFCYEPPALNDLLDQLAQSETPTRLLITAGRAAAVTLKLIESKNSVRPSWNASAKLTFFYVPLLSQAQFDELLWACDLNFVRGEDSLVRALWAGKPFVWQIYPQSDNAHHAKLEAFLDALHAPDSVRRLHRIWNGLVDAPLPELDPAEWADWQSWAHGVRDLLLQQSSLVDRLQEFVAKRR